MLDGENKDVMLRAGDIALRELGYADFQRGKG